jgi:glycosyltransferase involved in cell wall biosynthesis
MSKIKVVHIASGDLWAGAEVQLYTLLSNLNQRKDIDLLAILLNKGQLEIKLRNAGIKIKIIDEKQLGNVSVFLKIMSTLAKFKPEIVHTHRLKENIIGSIANKLTINSVCIRTVHGAPESTSSRIKSVIRWIDDFCGKHLQKKLIAVSSELVDKLNTKFCNKHIALIENGVDIKAIQEKSNTPAPLGLTPQTGHINIGLFGRLEPVKRPDIFIEVASLLTAMQSEHIFCFHIAGSGSLENSLREKVASLPTKNSITFHGHIDNIYPYIKAMDMILICSDHEGLPMTALESVALDTHLVTHKTGGLIDLLPRTSLVEDHTPIGYANAILNLIKNPTLLVVQRKFSSEKIHTNMSAKVNAEKVFQLYNTLLEIKKDTRN